MEIKAQGVCIIEGCSREATSRGLCNSCVAAARMATLRGKVTWETLEQLGLALPPKRRSAKCGKFAQALARAKQDTKTQEDA